MGVVATLVAEFTSREDEAAEDLDAGGGIPYQLELEPDTEVSTTRAKLRLYPAPKHSAYFAATYGGLDGGADRVETITESVVFTGTDRASTTRRIKTLLACDKVGDALRVREEGSWGMPGVDVLVSFGLGEDGALKASRPVIAVVRVTYEATYQSVYWSATNISCGATFENADHNSATPDTLVRDGGEAIDRIIAVAFPDDGQPATLELTPHCGAANAEALRVYSKYVIDETGSWEYPPDWPNGTWSGGSPDPEGAFFAVLCRSHAAGTVSRFGRPFTLETFDLNSALYPPFEGLSGWRPQYLYRRSSISDPILSAIAAALDWEAIIANLTRRFPGLIEDTSA